MSVNPSVMATAIYRVLSLVHRSDIVFGDKLAAEQPAETTKAEAIVQTTMAQTTVLHVDQADFISRMNRRRTRRIVASFENPREK